MDLSLIGSGVLVFLLIVFADRIDDVVDVLSSSDDPLTDFDHDPESSNGSDDADSSPNPYDDS